MEVQFFMLASVGVVLSITTWACFDVNSSKCRCKKCSWHVVEPPKVDCEVEETKLKVLRHVLACWEAVRNLEEKVARVTNRFGGESLLSRWSREVERDRERP